MRRIVLLLPVVLLFGCRHCVCGPAVSPSRSVAGFESANPPPVDSGRYPEPLRLLPSDHPLAVKAGALRADAESHENIVREVLRQRIAVKSPLEFRFMYVGLDSLNNRLILRYFSRAAVQDSLAGWQVQIVYRLPSLRLDGAYVQAVPLE